jgi:hypothetical protein
MMFNEVRHIAVVLTDCFILRNCDSEYAFNCDLNNTILDLNER